METIDFNQVIKDNISVVGELLLTNKEFINSTSASIYKNYTRVTLEQGKETLVGQGSGIYYLGYNDNLCQFVCINYNSHVEFGHGLSDCTYRVSGTKLYITSNMSSAITINVIKTYHPY